MSSNLAYVPVQRRQLVTNPEASRGELLLFRLIEGLSKRGPACVRTILTLVEMFNKPGGGSYSERSVWSFLGGLVKRGWLTYRRFYRRGHQLLEFFPLVRVAERSESRYFAPKTAKTASEIAPSIALSTPQNCTLHGGTSKNNKPLKGEDNIQTPDPVAVSLLENLVSSAEAEELAREAKKTGMTGDQLKGILEAYRSQRQNIRNRGAWLREAIRRKFVAPIASPTHPSEVREPLCRPVVIQKPPKPSGHLGNGYEAFANARRELTGA